MQSLKYGTLRKVLALLVPHKRLLLAGMVALAAGSSINLLFPQIIRELINGGYKHFLNNHPLLCYLLLAGLFALQAVSFYLRSLYFGIIGQKVVTQLRKNIFSSLVRREVEFFDHARSGDLISALSSDCGMIQDAVSVKLSVFIRYTFQVVFGLLIMSFISPRLSALTIVAVPLLMFISRRLGSKMKYWSRLQQENLGSGSALAAESFSNIRIVKAYDREVQEEKRFASSMDGVLEAGLKRSQAAAFFTSLVSFLINVLLLTLLFYGLHLVSAGSLSAGDLTAFVLYGIIVAVSFAFVVNGYSEFLQSLAATERVFDLLVDEDSDEGKPALFNAGFTPRIEFRQVSFAYPSRGEKPALNGIDLTIEPGKITALVGPSGAGKSTLVSLILGFYKPSNGEILISGAEMRQISRNELRRYIAYVPQEPHLFDLSIEDNLRYAKPDADIEELREVCKQTNLLDFIEGLPGGFNARVGEKGVQLSAGQKQRLAIARAMLRKPEILLLDEATASLDSQNEALVQQALDTLMKGKTTLVIAHRLSTVKSADKLVVMEGGRIVQVGTHSDLSAARGLYRDFVEKQELALN